ncbi:amidohydrolase family protein [Jidongwangia harbinensis]|uniref:amidohydrolase family protein n=1 Tax=Jidongwangia harbinensis TaxID=2878561 RepID=UPI001CDA35B7|nr:amidohydrolase family protein [Jidongwangia harbinensis]MCA2216394.1 amidohydrolase family protein [Jidongwangia harbinensis]
MIISGVTERPGLLAIRAAALFDGVTETLQPDPLIIVDGVTIVAVDSAVAPPPHARVLDLPGATLLPGLIDTHMHLVFDGGADPVTSLAARAGDEDAVVTAMAAAGRTALRAGVTTVRDLGDLHHLSLRLRGRDDLPTIVASGPPITTPAGHCHFLGGEVEPSEDAVRAAVAERADHGADVVKVMASGGRMTPGTRQELSQFPPAVLRAAVDGAHRLGLPVVAHAHGTASIRESLDAGVDGLEHVTFWSADGVDEPGDLIGRMVQSGVAVGITVGNVPVPGATTSPAVRTRTPGIITNFRRLHEAGARLLVGTDAGIEITKPHDVLPFAIAQAAAVLLGPAGALRAVTSTAAAACGLGSRKGRIAPGFDADILAVDGNPLTDITALRRVQAVLARGHQVNQDVPDRDRRNG